MSTAIVTGAGGALGADVARALAARGHALVLAGSAGSSAHLAELAKTLTVPTSICAADLATAAGWAEVLEAAGRLPVPIGAAAMIAGAWRGGAPHHESDDAVWDAMMTANLETVRRGLRAVLPGMVARRAGSVVVVGSRVVERPETGARAAAYTASKAAVVALARAVAAEVAPVRVNAVLPSTLDTRANRAAMPGADFSRWVTTSSCASVIAFLLSDDAKDVSGAAVPVFGEA